MIRFSRGRSGGPSIRPPTSPLSPSPGPLVSPASGSRFSYLVDDEEADDHRVQAPAEEVAWCGFQDEPLVSPVICRPDIPLEEVAKDFWCKIGFTTPESRSWQRSAASTGKAEVSSNDLSVLCRARSLSPVKTGRMRDDRRALLHRRWGCILLSHPVWVLGEVRFRAGESRLRRCSDIS
jgi:hypothetical protein